MASALPVQLARLLLEESHEGSVPLAQATLAAMLGARRPSVNKVLSGFAAEGWIELSYREVQIRDRAALESVATR